MSAYLAHTVRQFRPIHAVLILSVAVSFRNCTKWNATGRVVDESQFSEFSTQQNHVPKHAFERRNGLHLLHSTSLREGVQPTRICDNAVGLKMVKDL